jgi:hypothetical protein
MATADTGEKRAEAKSRVLNAIASVLCIIALVGVLGVVKVVQTVYQEYEEPPKVSSNVEKGLAFISSYINRGLDIDGNHGNQCADVSKAFVIATLAAEGITIPNDAAMGHGGYIADNLVHGTITDKNGKKISTPAGAFKKASYGRDNPPMPGDVLSFAAGGSFKYGHTAVIGSVEPDGNGGYKVTLIEQNWPLATLPGGYPAGDGKGNVHTYTTLIIGPSGKVTSNATYYRTSSGIYSHALTAARYVPPEERK